MNQQINIQKDESILKGSFQQKSMAVSLVIIGVTAINYFIRAYGLAQTGETLPDGALWLAVTTVIFISVVEAVLQTVLVIGAGGVDREEPNTAFKPTRNAYFVLVVGVFITFASLFSGVTPFVMANIALLSFVVAEMVRMASQLFYLSQSKTSL